MTAKITLLSPIEETQQGVQYKPLSQLELIRLIRATCEILPDRIMQAKADTNLTYFWMVFDLAGNLKRTDSDLIEGIQTFELLGYLPEGGAQTVLDAWPTK